MKVISFIGYTLLWLLNIAVMYLVLNSFLGI